VPLFLTINPGVQLDIDQQQADRYDRALMLAATSTIAASGPDSGTSGKNEITVTTSGAKSDFAANGFTTKAVTPRAGEPAGYCKQPNPMTTAVNRTMDCYHMPIKVSVKKNGRTVGPPRSRCGMRST
jgi:hypothetical protein